MSKSHSVKSGVTDNGNKYAVNFDNLSREFRDSIPVRPLYVFEGKKCHDIVEALLDIQYEDSDTDDSKKNKLHAVRQRVFSSKVLI